MTGGSSRGRRGWKYTQPWSIALLALAALFLGGANASDAASDFADVVVFLRQPPAFHTLPLDRPALKAQVREAQQRVLSQLARADFRVRYRYEAVPALAGSVSPQGLRDLAAHADVAAVWPDFELRGALSQSVPLINADDVHALGLTGSGAVVAVIDSGLDTDHPDLAASLVHEECFMAYPLLSSRCPDGSTRQTGPGAAQDDLGHGTNVTGVISGDGAVAPIGVAPDAAIVAIKIIDNNNSLGLSDLTAALDHILAAHPEVDFINMSLGTFASFPPGACFGAVYDALRAAGALSFAAAGNQGTKTGLGFPACVASVASVGAVYDASVGSFGTSACTDTTTAVDKVACWSNSDSSLDLLGPGCVITSTGLFGGTSSYCGTSQATPHAVGVAALLLDADPTLTPDQIAFLLESTGVPITDPANGVTTPRLNALAAVDPDGDSLPLNTDPDDDGDGHWDGDEADKGSDRLRAASTPEHCDGLDNDADTTIDEAPPGANWDIDGDTVKDCLDASIDTDGDGTANTADDDDDGDGLTDSKERGLTTDELAGCPSGPSHDAWPPDRDHDRDADAGDVITSFFGKVLNPAAYDARADANGDGDNDVGDVISLYMGNILTRCSLFTFTNGTGAAVDDSHVQWSSSIAQVFSARDSDLRGWSNRTLSGGGLSLDMDRPDPQGNLGAGRQLTVIVRGPSPAVSTCRWTLDGVDKGAC